MKLVQYLISVATRHEPAKDIHEEELQEQWQREKRGRSSKKFNLTYADETELLRTIVETANGKPRCLKKLSAQAIGSLAYIVMSKVSGDAYIDGSEIVGKLVCDPELTIEYLQSLGELQKQGWIRLIDSPGRSFCDEPPLLWLKAHIELGASFHKEMNSTLPSRTFNSNDAYLDAVFIYLKAIIQNDTELFRLDNPAANLFDELPHDYHRRIIMAVEHSNCPLPAAEVQKKFNLSAYQHLTLIGLFGLREGDLQYDFSNPGNVTRLFAKGRICRNAMKEHLFGEKSRLRSQQLLSGTNGSFGESIRLSPIAISALSGKSTINNQDDIKKLVKKQTLFDCESPKIRQDAVMLPAPVMEAIRCIVFSESQKGKYIRKQWHTALPAAWGAPTGSTILLYGPPGTGKTLTAQYLASELKLPLLKIDAAKVLSCWVGESEQNSRRIFDDYAMLQQETGKSPVLLLNEADQLLGNRDSGSSSVDKMHNNMQNLFLEGLEKFAGILVATTNRRDLLDDAFSRRFTYKLELPPPDRILRMKLWKTHLPEKRLADDVDIGLLAELGLTGGEIRLVVERAVRIAAYRGLPKIHNSLLKELADEERASRLKKFGNARSIGFDTTRR